MEKINLPTVTLLLVDCVDYKRAKLSFDHCCSYVNFGAAHILTSLDIDSPEVVKIPHIGSIPEYSDFMVYKLADYVHTEHVLVAQWDGFIRNIELWSDDFLQYDYIGAPWPESVLYPGVPKQFNVGNGGFSLRSKKLIDCVSKDPKLTYHHLEDVMICQLNRAYLEMKDFTFAPLEVAKQFSWECGPEHPSFGVHARIKLVQPTYY